MPRRSPFTSVTPGALHRHVGARAHGDAHVGLRQRRRVVDAVAGHGHDVPFGLEALDDLRFCVGQDLGLDLVDAERAPDGLGGRRGCRR